ncbi:MAG: amino acid permease [Phycisphaerae bacterium]|nr:amino acid permease [Phycisphaerae bacterium]
MSDLKKQLGLLHVFSVATGAMISSGLFILPALAFSKAGPAMIFSYLFASIMILPSVLSNAELTTAMPKAGGIYFHVERSLGSMLGLFVGLTGWFSLTLKSSFAVLGLAILVQIVLPMISPFELDSWHLKIIASLCCLGFTAINLFSVEHTSRLQNWLVFILLSILLVFICYGFVQINTKYYQGFFDKGWPAIFATSGMVFVSFGGLTKADSIAEEVKNPGRNIPLGVFLAWTVASVFYLAIVTIIVGVMPADQLSQSQLPVSHAAQNIMGIPGFVILSVAAIAAFATTANGGILSASRAPMAMARDQLLPSVVGNINKRFNTPHVSIVLTGLSMAAVIILLDLEALVKTASTIMILLFILANISVIVMRESKLQSYRPKFKSPLYPYVHIIAIVLYVILIIDMGMATLLIAVGFALFSITWYYIYIAKRASRTSAVMHIVNRITSRELKTESLEDELRNIVLERDEIIEDRFDQLVRDCEILDISYEQTADEAFHVIAELLSPRLNISPAKLYEKFLDRQEQGSTIIQPGMSIPHIIVDGENIFDILPVRCISGIKFPESEDPVKVMFVLVGSRDQRNYHLRALMTIAQISQEDKFESRWFAAKDPSDIRNLILLSKRKRQSD